MPSKKYYRKTVRWDGKKYEVYGKTEEEAIEKLAVLKDQLRRGAKTTRDNITVSQWFEEWLDLYKKPAGLTQKSLAMYREKFDGYIKPRIGPMRLRDVTEAHLQRVLNSQEGMSYSHVSKLRLVIKGMFSRAYNAHMIPWDPSVQLTIPANQRGTRRSLTDDERTHVLAVAEDHRAGLWILLALYTGIRNGEAAALQWKDVDFKANEIRIHKAIESGSGAVKGPKTASGHRDIPIHPDLLPILRDAQREPQDPVLTNTRGKAMTSDGLQRAWHSFIRALDIHMGAKLYRNKIVESKVAPDLTPYCLRHTFCTDLQRAGVPINVAKELMGHSDITVTANIYTHKDQSVLHDNIKKLSVVGKVVGRNEEEAQSR